MIEMRNLICLIICLFPSVSALIQLNNEIYNVASKKEETSSSFDFHPSSFSMLSISLDEYNGSYNISLNNKIWFHSNGKGISLRNNHKLYTIDDGCLFLDKVQVINGKDQFGQFDEIQMIYKTFDINSNINDNEVKTMYGNIRMSHNGMITFEQLIISDLFNTSTGNSDGVITRFPVFDIIEDEIPNSYCLFTSWDQEFPINNLNQSWLSPTCHLWSKSSKNHGGIAGTGPMVIYEETSLTLTSSDSTSTSSGSSNDFPSFVLSPLTNIMALNLDTSNNGQIAYGIIGNTTFVPAGFSTRTILFHGNGINGVMSAWGKAMRKWYNKPYSSRNMDITLQYLGYSTDNGAYYYYNTNKDENYEETMMSVKQDSIQSQLPFKYTLLDSWWYLKGLSNGVQEWEATQEVFPNGMAAVYNQTNWLIQAHNRWFDPETIYAKVNGGQYNFEIDNNGALPLEQVFWDVFLNNKSTWGLRVYEQDWLYNQFYEKVKLLQEDPTLGRKWLTQMARGAAKNGLTIQYCMPHMRHLLTSLEFSSVTQARASDDYKPSNQQWAIGGQNVLLDALGLSPSKDSYWSSTNQPGNPYEGTIHEEEPYPETQAVVTTLSAGPVATSDGIGYANVDLIMRSCMKDGRLLQASSPAKLLDRAFRFMAQPTYGDGIDGQVWGSWSIASGRVFGYIFAANLSNTYVNIIPSDLNNLHSEHISSNYKSSNYKSSNFKYFNQHHHEYGLFNQGDVDMKWIAVNVRNVLNNNVSQPEEYKLIYGQVFSNSNPLTLTSCEQDDFALWAILPLEPNGMAYLGEMNKWIGTSSARLLSMSSQSDSQSDSFAGNSITVELAGSSGEELMIGFVLNDYSIQMIKCNVTETGRVFVSNTGCVGDA